MRSMKALRLRKGFTLVELLVVIGILTVLIALLLPVLSRAREQANRLKCAANLRSMGQAMALYTQQYGYYPGCLFEFQGFTTSAFGWPVRLRPFLAGYRQVFYCPTQDPRCEWSDSAAPSRGTILRATAAEARVGYELGEQVITAFTYFSYGYNNWGTSDNGPHATGLGDITHPAPRATQMPELKASRVKRPAEMIAITDSTADGIYDAISQPHSGVYPNIPGGVHGGGANVLFCDGHVTWYPQKDLILTSRSPSKYRTRTWNYDHGLGHNSLE